MPFSSVRTFNYRNLVDNEIEVEEKEVFLVGENGQGKTNFLESIYLLCFGSSFRAIQDSDCIRHGEAQMSLAGRAVDSGGVATDIALRLDQRKKTITVNGKRIKDRKTLIEKFPCIVFCHEDIDFVTGAPDRRRWFFNQTMSLNTPLFLDTLRRYNHVKKMRNAAIRDGRTSLLPILDEQLATAGLDIQKRRETVVDEFNDTFTRIFTQVSGLSDELRIQYSPSWKAVRSIDDVLIRLEEKRASDLALLTTTSGPHRDRFAFILDGHDFARSASTGQLRLISLVLRVSQSVYYLKTTRRTPILLLDDVLLELDAEKRRRFINVLPDYEQAFFTFLPDERFESYRNESTMVFDVQNGQLMRQKAGAR